MKPLFSIIIPIYNSQEYLPQCIDSILQQNYKNIEIILINDGSTDKSLQICKYYLNNKNITLINQANSGVSNARNKALDIIQGEYVLFIDSDDILLDQSLEIIHKYIQSKKWDLVLFNSNSISLCGNKKTLLNYTPGPINNYIMHIKHFALWGYVFKNSIIQQHKIRFVNNLAYSEDRIFIYQYAIHTSNTYLAPEIIYAYRINENSVCQSKNGLRKAKHQFWAASILNEMANIPLFQTCKKQLNQEYKKTINFGFYSFIETKTRLQKINELYKLYNSYFPKNLLIFSLYYIKNTLLYIKRCCGNYIRKVQSNH